MKVTYMNGAGNDFMVMDARGGSYDFSALAKSLCALRNADGFMAVDNSDKADFRLHFYNADGTRGEMCGNGARCICRYAHELGMVGDTMTVETDAGIVKGWRVSEDIYRVQLNNPSVLDLNRKEATAYVELGCPGVPHAVQEYAGDLYADAAQLHDPMQALRWDAAFPKGANVNFYSWIGPDTVQVLTFERGVEDYTLACGTGCGSVACVLWKQGKLPGGTLTAVNRGGTLRVTIRGGEAVEAVLLEGPTQLTEVLSV